MLARERERERKKKEKKKERQKEKEKGKGEGAGRAERGEKKEQHVHHVPGRTCLRRRGGPGGTNKRRKEREPRPTPRERGGRRGRERRKEESDPETAAPESQKRRKKNKNSLNQIRKSIQKHTPGSRENKSNTNHGVRCPKPSAKTRRNKNRTPEKT